MLADVELVEVLQAAMLAGVEHDHDGYYFGIRHAAGPVPVLFPVIFLYGMFFDSLVEKFAEVVCHIVNFCNFVVG